MRITVRDVRSGFEARSGGARQLIQIHGREQRMLYGLKSVEKLLANGGKPLLMLSGCGWNCSGSGQRPVGLMRELALLGYAAIYHSTLERETRLVDNVLVIDRVGLDAAMPVLLKERGSVISTLPTWMPLVRSFISAGWRFVYDLIDDWDEFVAAGDLNKSALQNEREMITSADVVTCSAPRLVCRASALGAKEPRLILNGGPAGPLPVPEDPPADMLTEGVRAVYSGYLFGSWLDWNILNHLRDTPGISTTVVGKYENVQQAPSLRFVNEKPYAEAMRYVACGHVGIIPFRGKLCYSVDPIKAYDYWAGGLWCVSTPDVEPLAGRPYVILARREEFPEAVLAAAEKKDRPTAKFIAANSWKARAKKLAKELC